MFLYLFQLANAIRTMPSVLAVIPKLVNVHVCLELWVKSATDVPTDGYSLKTLDAKSASHVIINCLIPLMPWQPYLTL